MGLRLDDPMRERLRRWREAQLAELRVGRMQGAEDFLGAGETVCLWCGAGNASTLDLDGRVLYWNYGDGLPAEELTDPLSIASVVRHGAEAGMPELLEFLPEMPPNGATCRQCRGSRWMPEAGRDGVARVCVRCHGLGWTVG